MSRITTGSTMKSGTVQQTVYNTLYAQPNPYWMNRSDLEIAVQNAHPNFNLRNLGQRIRVLRAYGHPVQTRVENGIRQYRIA